MTSSITTLLSAYIVLASFVASAEFCEAMLACSPIIWMRGP